MYCRYVLFGGTEELSQELSAVFEDRISYKPNYNTAPGSRMPVIVQNMNGWRTIEHFTWGLIPFWATEKVKAENTTHVRADTLSDKSVFRPYFTNRRCLIPARGFYEWRNVRGKTIPFYNSPKEGSIIAMAGLYSKWESPAGELFPTYCLITASSELSGNKIPAILPPKNWNFWLDPANQNTDELLNLLVPADSVELSSHAVSNKVDNLKLNNPDLILPYTASSDS